MKKCTLLLLMFAGLANCLAAAPSMSPPSLLFSDLTSGPVSGGKENLGAIVTVVGRNFGAVQAGGYVTVGGVKAASYLFWSDTKISFQPGSGAASGEIAVTTAGGVSNGLRFTVRGGSVYFVDDNSPGSPGSGTYADPWRNVSSFLSAMKPGDILYFRGGSYGDITLGSGQANGASGSEIAFIGYPGETALVSGSRQSFDFQDGRAYFVVAGLKLTAPGETISITGNHIRIANNAIEGLKSHAYGMIHPTVGSDIQIYGNTFTGATSGNKLDHPIYVGYGADNVDIGWNRIYNNNVDRGPVISVNTDGAQQAGYKFENIRIHDNFIDCNGARGIGVVCTQAGSSVYIYNNVFTGNSQQQTVYAYSGSLYLYNNVFYGAPGAATVQLTTMSDGTYTYYPETVEIKNNIIYNLKGGQYFEIINENEMGKLTIENNAYCGAGSGPTRDAKAVNADPLFVNAAQGNFMLQQVSPCVNAGADISAAVPFDMDGYPRFQGGAVDMGACEYAAARTPSSGNDTGSGDTGGGDTTDPPVPVSTLSIRMNDILVLGSAARRGTIDPSRGETARIYFHGAEVGTYRARICTLSGDPVWEKAMQNVSEGMFEWVPRDMASAIYVVNVQGPGLQVTKKIAILK